MKLLLLLAHYHIVYLIIKLIQINPMFIRLKDHPIFIKPFIDPYHLFHKSLTSLLFTKYYKKDQCFAAHHEFWCLFLPLTFWRFLTPNYAIKVLKPWFTSFFFCLKKINNPINTIFRKKKTTPHTIVRIHHPLF